MDKAEITRNLLELIDWMGPDLDIEPAADWVEKQIAAEIANALDPLVEDLEDLSAAPASGRVLFCRRIETDFDETIRFWEYDESGERRYVGELYEPIADWAFDFKPKILSITEAPCLSAAEE